MYGWEYRELLRNIPSVALPMTTTSTTATVGRRRRDANDIVPA